MLTIIIAVWLLVAAWSHGWATARSPEWMNLLVLLWPVALITLPFYLLIDVLGVRWKRWRRRYDRAPRIIMKKPGVGA